MLTSDHCSCRPHRTACIREADIGRETIVQGRRYTHGLASACMVREGGREGERETERDRDRDRQTDRDRDTERETERDRQRVKHFNRERER